jgi:hypothetical protein
MAKLCWVHFQMEQKGFDNGTKSYIEIVGHVLIVPLISSSPILDYQDSLMALKMMKSRSFHSPKRVKNWCLCHRMRARIMDCGTTIAPGSPIALC